MSTDAPDGHGWIEPQGGKRLAHKTQKEKATAKRKFIGLEWHAFLSIVSIRNRGSPRELIIGYGVLPCTHAFEYPG